MKCHVMATRARGPVAQRWGGRRAAVAAYNRAKPDAATISEPGDEIESRQSPGGETGRAQREQAPGGAGAPGEPQRASAAPAGPQGRRGAAPELKAFSLIELLVATTLSVAMLALIVASLRHISRLALLGENRLVLHQSMAGIHRVLDNRLRAVHPCTAWHFAVDPVPPAGFPGISPLPAGSFSLTFMASSASLTDRNGGLREKDTSDMVWWRLVWMPPPAGASSGSRLVLIPGAGIRTSRGSWWYYNPDRYGIPDPNTSTQTLYNFNVGDWARRDRRRDMNDNDFRFWDGMTAVMNDNITNRGTASRPDIDGDDATLWYLLASGRFDLLRGHGVEIPACAISWRDQGGHTVTYDSAAGAMVRRDATGAMVPALGHAWDNALVADRDGLFADARPAVPDAPGETRSVQRQRPALVQLAFTLTRRLGHLAGGRDERDADGNAIVSQRFHLSFPMTPILPRP